MLDMLIYKLEYKYDNVMLAQYVLSCFQILDIII